jgi:hypothetical protein
MAIGDQPPELIDILDWNELYAHDDDHDDTIIPGLAHRGRWTAINAGAKAGKSTFIVGLAIATAHKHDITVLYLDAEMGRTDMLDRLSEWMQLKPEHLTRIHYSDLPPKLDTIAGAARLGNTINHYKPDLIIIDGLNGVIQGAENDDTPWRDLYEWAIAPCKAANLAIISADNTGHSDLKRPRGHSVKLDKADAVINLERTDEGVKLTCTHRRTASYPLEQYYRVNDPSPDGPPMTVTPIDDGQPEGTADIIALLDLLHAPTDIGVRAARRLIRDAGRQARNEAIDAARNQRRDRINNFGISPAVEIHPAVIEVENATREAAGWNNNQACPDVPGARLSDVAEVCPEGVPHISKSPGHGRGVSLGHRGVGGTTGHHPETNPDTHLFPPQ